jgi:hypothetical protein
MWSMLLCLFCSAMLWSMLWSMAGAECSWLEEAAAKPEE